MFSTSVIEISKDSLQHNINFLKNQMGKKVKISSVVKGNAYGHGIKEFVPLAEECGLDHFSVYSADEALDVYKYSNGNSDIMIMGMVENEELEWAINTGIEFYVFDIDRLKKTIEYASHLNRKAKIHVEIETGMNRTGFTKEYISSVIKIIKENKDVLSVKGLCTHFAGAESIANYVRIQKQLKNYSRIHKLFIENNVIPEKLHTACSAASMTYPKSRMDMVRIGIMQYGFWSSRETFIGYINNLENKADPLKRIIKWKSRIMSTKSVKTGEFIGYGTSYLAQRDMKIATIPVGYAHGYSRELSNQGRVLINGHRVSVIGIVNMNMMTIDITDVSETKKGDEAVLIGKQGDLAISVASFSELSNQLDYELLTRLNQKIPRMVV
ncbi:MAG: alanine racemase [Ignavibacteriaceae bacterium]